jgi:methionine-rich copper-binding protein CopC
LISRNRVLVAAASSLVVLILLVNVHLASAHAVLLQSSPAVNSSVKGPDVAIRLRYNVRVEASRCRLSLLLPDKSVKSVSIVQPSPDTLTAEAAGMLAGEYRLRWQVLASDGHITRGEIPFNVTP